MKKCITFAVENKSRSGAVVARQAHNLEVVRSNRASATKPKTRLYKVGFSFSPRLSQA